MASERNSTSHTTIRGRTATTTNEWKRERDASIFPYRNTMATEGQLGDQLAMSRSTRIRFTRVRPILQVNV